jgi:hypothetical protein
VAAIKSISSPVYVTPLPAKVSLFTIISTFTEKLVALTSSILKVALTRLLIGSAALANPIKDEENTETVMVKIINFIKRITPTSANS